MEKKAIHRSIIAFIAMLLTAGTVLAASSGSDTAAPQNPDFDKGRSLVAAGDYAGAIPLLRKTLATDPKNADAENLLGYSYRKTGEREKALEHYLNALALDPEHRGANEYLGELYLESGELAKAEERLAVLDKACFFGCEEYKDLKEAIAEYKSKNDG